jgi:hypothetical protein
MTQYSLIDKVICVSETIYLTIIRVEVKMGDASSFQSLLSIHDTKYCHPKDNNMISSNVVHLWIFIYFNSLCSIVLFEKHSVPETDCTTVIT